MTADFQRFDVLRSLDEAAAATQDLRERGWVDFGSALDRSRHVAAARRLIGLGSGRFGMLPDPLKSWDVLRAVEAVRESGGPETPVLDVGSVGCPVLACLLSLGYEQLHGVDLDPRVAQMPGADRIDYRVEDMMHTRWPDASFGAITAISVIEHGYDQDALLDEVARLLRPGGVFIFSTDYWPQKLSTEGTRLFGLDWQIFSAQEIEAMVDAARERGLRPVADPRATLREPLERTNGKPPISFEGREYTFLYGAFVRAAQPAAAAAS